MELDKIIYDKDKLAQALTDQLIAESPTFNAMYPSDTATALVNVLAAYGSMMNYFFASAMAVSIASTSFPSATSMTFHSEAKNLFFTHSEKDKSRAPSNVTWLAS